MGPCCISSLNNFIRGVLMKLILLCTSKGIAYIPMYRCIHVLVECSYFPVFPVVCIDSIKPHP